MSLRILLADDHQVLREGLAVLFVKAGMEVVASVGDGREAVRAAREAAPDVCVLDLSMPGMNGIDAARAIRSRSPDIQVVILSMHSGVEHVFQALDAGAIGYVLKDSAAEEIVAAVRAARNARRYVSPAIGELPARDGARGPIESLSSRERQVLQLVVEGKSSAEIAKLVHLSPKSVQTYRSRLMRKLGVGDLAGLVKFALRHGLTPPG